MHVAAEHFLKWATESCSEISEEYQLFCQFSNSLLTELQSCFKPSKSIQAAREHLCTKYHGLRTSANFHSSWKFLLEHSIHTTPGPLFYQQVTHNILANMINQPSSAIHPRWTVARRHLTNIEENVLRYVAGYICHKIISQLMKSTHQHKLQLLFMSDTSEMEMNISDATYDFFHEMEMVLLEFFKLKVAVTEPHSKPSIIKNIYLTIQKCYTNGNYLPVTK